MFIRLLWTIIVLASVAAVALASFRFATAQSEHRAAVAALDKVRTDTQTIASARAALPAWAISAQANSDDDLFAQRVAAAVASVGLGGSSVTSINVDALGGAPSTGGVRVARRTATVTLGSITLPQLGNLLQAWRSREPAWTVTGIAIDPGSPAQAQPGADIPLRVVLSMETISIAHSASTAATTGNTPRR